MLLLEDLVGKADLHLYDGLLVHYACLGSAVVDEELLVVYLYRLSTFHIAHEAAEEVVIKVVLFDLVESILFVGTCLFISLVVRPERGNPDGLNMLGSRGIYF